MVTPYFGASGTGQMNAVFPVTAERRWRRDTAAQASAARAIRRSAGRKGTL